MKISRIFIGLFVFSIIISIIPTSFAQEIDQPDIWRCYDYAAIKNELPHEYETSLALIRIGEIDKKSGSYEASFWFSLNIDSEYDNTDFKELYAKNEPDWEIVHFVNADSRDITFSSKTIERHFYLAKVEGTFFNEFDYSNFPFEQLSLTIEVETNFVNGTDGNIYNTIFTYPFIAAVPQSKTPGWNIAETTSTVDVYEYDPDSDGDKISDSWEEYHKTDPKDPTSFYTRFLIEHEMYLVELQSEDSDGDGTGDEDERYYGTDPNARDTDKDGLLDTYEYYVGTLPTFNSTNENGDLDGLELYKNAYLHQGIEFPEWQMSFYEPKENDFDSDKDGLLDDFESRFGLDPNEPDTDGDELLDGFELQGDFKTLPDRSDSDNDGVPDGAEFESTWCHFIGNFVVEQDHIGSFLKIIFPIILMTSLALLVLWLPKEFMTKIELNAIFLLGVVFFTQIIVENIPPVGYLTIFDKVLIMCYSLLALTIMSPAIQMRMENKGTEEKIIKKVDKTARYLIPVIIIIGFLSIFLPK